MTHKRTQTAAMLRAQGRKPVGECYHCKVAVYDFHGAVIHIGPTGDMSAPLHCPACDAKCVAARRASIVADVS